MCQSHDVKVGFRLAFKPLINHSLAMRYEFDFFLACSWLNFIDVDTFVIAPSRDVFRLKCM